MDVRRGPSRASASAPPPSDAVLVERLRAEIERDGPITFARFMEVALYDPERGYYASPVARPTREGDFLTAPETHPVFGRCVGRQLTECWERLDRPDPFVLREYGAGAGTLGLSVLQGLAADDSELAEAIRYEPVEVNPYRRAELAERLAEAGVDARLGLPEGPVLGVVMANEFLDALPVHRVEGRPAGLVELYVAWDGRGFVDVAGPPSTPALAERLGREGVSLADGQRGEICLRLDAWVAEVAAALERGYVLAIDYGYPAVDLYAPRRRAGTLLAYAGHRVHDDPYRHIGGQDLTAHVDLTALELAGRAAGLTTLGSTSQAEFLAGLGLGELLASAGQASSAALGEYLELRSAALRMLDPRAMGAFRVVVLGRRVSTEPALRGLAFRLPPRPGQGLASG